MPELTTLYDYLRASARLLGTRFSSNFRRFTRFMIRFHPASKVDCESPFRASDCHHGAGQTPARGEDRYGRCRVRHWQDADIAWSHSRPQRRKALHGTGDGPSASGRKVGAGGVSQLAGVRVFFIDDLRNGGDENKFHGVNEVRLRQGRIAREGLRTSWSELRLRRDSPISRKRWLSLCGRPSLLIVGRERAKLGYFCRHAYQVPRSGPTSVVSSIVIRGSRCS